MTWAGVVGTLLVLLSWAVLSAVLLALGLVPARMITDRRPRGLPLRGALWWGLLVLTLLLLATSPFAGAGSSATWTVVTGVALAGGGWSAWRLRREPSQLRRPTRPTWPVVAYLIALGCAVTYLAYKALGPVTHYDAGLYQLGAVRYASKLGAPHGLALLASPLGYSNTEFLLGGFMSGGPWGAQGFRLLNGLVILVVCIDLALRLLGRRFTWGTFILLAGVTSLAFPFLGMADFWVTSPTADTPILFLSLIAVAYLADFLGGSTERSANLGAALAALVIACTMRPTMLAFALAVIAVALVDVFRRRNRVPPPDAVAWILPGIASLMGAGLLAARDYLLSGWLAFPLTFFHWDVPWLAPDPTGLRDATLAAARDPYTSDGWLTAHSWSWIAPWFSRLGSEWETYFLVAAFTVAGALWGYAAYRKALPGWRLVALCCTPGIVGVAFWFLVTPPSFRFGWGPLLTLPMILIGAVLAALHQREPGSGMPPITRIALGGSALVVLLLVAFCVLTRSQSRDRSDTGYWHVGGISIPYSLAPIPIPPVNEVPLPTGVVVLIPVEGEQCWGAWPLCTYQYEPRLAFRGSGLSDGFVLIGKRA